MRNSNNTSPSKKRTPFKFFKRRRPCWTLTLTANRKPGRFTSLKMETLIDLKNNQGKTMNLCTRIDSMLIGPFSPLQESELCTSIETSLNEWQYVQRNLNKSKIRITRCPAAIYIRVSIKKLKNRNCSIHADGLILYLLPVPPYLTIGRLQWLQTMRMTNLFEN